MVKNRIEHRNKKGVKRQLDNLFNRMTIDRY